MMGYADGTGGLGCQAWQLLVGDFAVVKVNGLCMGMHPCVTPSMRAIRPAVHDVDNCPLEVQRLAGPACQQLHPNPTEW